MDLKEKLRRNHLTLGSWISLGEDGATEIMAKAGFDWLVVDMEHSGIDLTRAENLVRIIELCGCTALVRVGENQPHFIKQAMDIGAKGVIVPMVNTREDALRAVSSVKYPPIGKRGVGLGRAQRYGLEFQRYKNWVNKESIVIVQVEDFAAVDNLEKILKVKEIDGFIVGPYDLSASLGKPGEFSDPAFLEAMKRIKAVASKYKVASGFHVIPPDAKEVNKMIKQGYTFIGFSLDALFLGRKCIEEIKQINKR